METSHFRDPPPTHWKSSVTPHYTAVPTRLSLEQGSGGQRFPFPFAALASHWSTSRPADRARQLALCPRMRIRTGSGSGRWSFDVTTQALRIKHPHLCPAPPCHIPGLHGQSNRSTFSDKITGQSHVIVVRTRNT